MTVDVSRRVWAEIQRQAASIRVTATSKQRSRFVRLLSYVAILSKQPTAVVVDLPTLKEGWTFFSFSCQNNNACCENNCSNFYRAMHFSANARSWDRMSSVRPSVRLSVTLVICDHIS